MVLSSDSFSATYEADVFDGVTLIHAQMKDDRSLKLIPYYTWAHRGQGEMNV